MHCLSEKTRERVSCASEKGLVKLKESAQERQKHRDFTNRAAIDRISGTNTAPLVWHKSCYSTFTSPTHISRVYKKNEAALSAASRTTTAPDTTPLALPSTRSSTYPMNWEACMFCQSASDMSMVSSVTTLKMSQHILDLSRFDQLANIRLSGVIDLIASEGKYHGICYKQFIRDISKRKKNSKTTDVAMLWLTDELRCAADQVLVLELAEVWRHYSSQKTMGFWRWFMLR